MPHTRIIGKKKRLIEKKQAGRLPVKIPGKST
jgi:hypothetical protein